MREVQGNVKSGAISGMHRRWRAKQNRDKRNKYF